MSCLDKSHICVFFLTAIWLPHGQFCIKNYSEPEKKKRDTNTVSQNTK